MKKFILNVGVSLALINIIMNLWWTIGYVQGDCGLGAGSLPNCTHAFDLFTSVIGLSGNSILIIIFVIGISTGWLFGKYNGHKNLLVK